MASWQHAYADLLPAGFLAGLSVDDDARRWRQALGDASRQLFVCVAERPPGTIIGFAAGGPNHREDGQYDGELQAIYLDPACQRQGVGAALARAVAVRLADLAMPSMIVWVLAENPARHFYEALGGQRAGHRQLELAGLVLDAIAYGWRDTAALRAGETTAGDGRSG
ncbi:MAG TPA: GNAT family N-acetyltransferase [Vicinamibacterales bacterium]|nr:GNAT family N-acetyltransferase [Vicinamibacterales bacterium]